MCAPIPLQIQFYYEGRVISIPVLKAGKRLHSGQGILKAFGGDKEERNKEFVQQNEELQNYAPGVVFNDKVSILKPPIQINHADSLPVS